MKTYAFALTSDPKRVSLWCERRGMNYWVINGSWQMNPRKDDYVLIWEGEVPEEHADDYNEAMAWIREQVDADH